MRESNRNGLSTKSFDIDGFAVVSSTLSNDECDQVLCALSAIPRRKTSGGVRNLLSISSVANLARHPVIARCVEGILGQGAYAYKATLFEKTPHANWLVTWHQDTSIPVAHRKEAEGWSGWSVKSGVNYVRPPVEFLERVVAVRVHLDESTNSNGPLRVAPGSHLRGIISESVIANANPETNSVVCVVPRGGLLLMRPLLLHASSKAISDDPRRVLHFEFTNASLPTGLDWSFIAPIDRRNVTS